MNRTQFIRLLLLAPLGGQRLAAAESSFDESIEFLLAKQSPDGAWRSDIYGAFRDGRALTPVVLRCLARIPDRSLDPAREKASTWLREQGDPLFAVFPVHLAAALLETAPFVDSLSPLRRAAVARLLELQNPDGGWSYSSIPSDPALLESPMQQSNVSATAIALDGLHSAGIRSYRDPLKFLGSCQNHDTGEPTYDDGGFFQMPIDPARNKAGAAGTDRHGKLRFRSYVASTSDGLRCLLGIGESSDSAAVTTARSWLNQCEWSLESVPVDLAYYSARSIVLSATLPGGRTSPSDLVAQSLLRGRRNDGSWINSAGEMRENCPVVATCLALEAITLSAI